MYKSSKTYGHEVGLSCCFRQWRADSHCRFMHGYALKVRLDFEADFLDSRNWVVDFGSLKDFKAWLVEMFDHTTLVAYDDPHLPEFQELERAGLVQLRVVDHVGCEAFAEGIFNAAKAWLRQQGYAPRVRLTSVEVSEHGANSATYTGAN